jgi:hypothetical protein
MRVRGAGRADRQFISKDRVPWQEDKKQDSFRDRLTEPRALPGAYFIKRHSRETCREERHQR